MMPNQAEEEDLVVQNGVELLPNSKEDPISSPEEDGKDIEVSEALDLRVSVLLLSLSVALFFFVVIPIITALPWYSYPWLNVGDVWKIVDPVVTLPLFYYLLMSGPLYQTEYVKPAPGDRGGVEKMRFGTTLLFLVGAAVYVEGHGMHTVLTIVKDPIKYLILIPKPDVAAANPEVEQIYNFIRDDWQHLYSHYIYVAGVLVMTVAHLFAYYLPSGRVVFPTRKSGTSWAAFSGACVVYGLLFAGVSANFPQGLTVGIVWIGLYLVSCAVFKYRRGRVSEGLYRTFGKDIMVDHITVSYLISLICIVVYVAIYGWINREQAGIELN